LSFEYKKKVVDFSSEIRRPGVIYDGVLRSTLDELPPRGILYPADVYIYREERGGLLLVPPLMCGT
jgi:hypothetical protein